MMTVMIWDSYTHQFLAVSSPALYWLRLHRTLCLSIPSLLHHWFSVHKQKYKHLLNNISYNNVNGKKINIWLWKVLYKWISLKMLNYKLVHTSEISSFESPWPVMKKKIINCMKLLVPVLWYSIHIELFS